MATIFVARKPFKTCGIFYALGSIITDPSAIKFFRTKLREGKIVEVDESNAERIAEYVNAKTNVNPIEDFKSAIEEANKKAIEAVAEKAKESAETIVSTPESKVVVPPAIAKIITKPVVTPKSR